MNKQELIEKYESKRQSAFLHLGEHLNDKAYTEILEDLKQLDEPQKVKVSEEEAKFLETFDFNCESDVTTALFHVSRTGWGYYLKDNNGIDLKDLTEGFGLENRKRLIKAILDGYEVEKEKRYIVKVKNVFNHSSMLKLDSITGRWFFGSDKYMCGSSEKHTRKELENAGFGEVFNSPLFEVEEVGK